MEKDEYRDDETLEQEDVEETEEVEDDEESEDEESDESEDSVDWQAEAKKWKAIATRKKKKSDKPELKTKAEKPEDDEVTARLSSLETAEKKRQFGYEHGLSPEETDKIFQINPNPNAETLKDPFVKAGLEALRRNKRVEQNTPSSSAKSSSVISKKFKDLSPDEKNAEWQKLMKQKGVLK